MKSAGIFRPLPWLLGTAAVFTTGCYTKLYTRSEVVRHYYGYPAEMALETDTLGADSLAEGDSVAVDTIVRRKKTIVIHEYYHSPRPWTYWDFSLGYYSPYFRDYYGGYYWHDRPYRRHYYHHHRDHHRPGGGGSSRPPRDPDYKSDKRLFNEPFKQDQPKKGKRRKRQEESHNRPAPKGKRSAGQGTAVAASDGDAGDGNAETVRTVSAQPQEDRGHVRVRKGKRR